MMVFKKAIPRRTFLRGAGAAVALPLLDSMVPAFGASAKPVLRVSTIYNPNGMNMDKWTPATDGSTFEFSPILKPLAPFRERLLVLSGLNNNAGDPLPSEGENAPHERSGGVFLTGVHPRKEGRVSISADQLIAKELGKDTQLFRN